MRETRIAGRVFRSSVFTLLGGLAFSLSAPMPPAHAAEQVDLKLVLATDVSRSISDDKMRLERQGTADAFLAPEIVAAIQNGPLGKIAVAMLDFSSPAFDKVVMDWQIVSDRASATALATKIRNAPRTPGQGTSISSALELGTQMLETSEKDIVGRRSVIDVSGDGPNNDGDPMTSARDMTLAKGIVINGLPILDERGEGYVPGLDKYYASCVAGGKGSFVVAVRNYRDYGAAMRHKLVLEISQINLETREANDRPLKTPPVFKAAVAPNGAAAQFLRPGPSAYSNQCNIGVL